MSFGHNRTELAELAAGFGNHHLLLDAAMTVEVAGELPLLSSGVAYLARHSGEVEYLAPRIVDASHPWHWRGSTHGDPSTSRNAGAEALASHDAAWTNGGSVLPTPVRKKRVRATRSSRDTARLPARRLAGAAVLVALLAGSCGADDDPSVAAAVTPTTTEPAPTSTQQPSPSPEATPTAADPTPTSESPTPTPTSTAEDGDAGEEALFPVDLGYPEIGVIVGLEVGDISCYATVVDHRGTISTVGATFEVCELADGLLGTTSRLVYGVESVADCESSEPCGQSRDEFLISETVPLGRSWFVMANDDWIVTVGRTDSWEGVNNTGDLTYYTCDAKPGPLVAGLNDPRPSCLGLTGGTVDCKDGTCAMGWRNGEFTYVVLGPIAEFGDPGPSTLQVRESDALILESPGLRVTDSSDAVARLIAVEIDPATPQTVVSGAAVLGERFVYSVEAEAGQTMKIAITSTENNAVFELYSPQGSAMTAESTEFELPSTMAGTYLVVVGGTRGNASYDLSVSLL